jgi:hypothetical protein
VINKYTQRSVASEKISLGLGSKILFPAFKEKNNINVSRSKNNKKAKGAPRVPPRKPTISVRRADEKCY